MKKKYYKFFLATTSTKVILLSIAVIILIASVNSDNWDHCANEYYFGGGNTFNALHCVLYPQTIVNALNSSEGVDVYLWYEGKTLIEVDMDIIPYEPQTIIDYLDSLYDQYSENVHDTRLGTFAADMFPEYGIPTCVYDYHPTQRKMRSVYLYNGQYITQDDGKC